MPINDEGNEFKPLRGGSIAMEKHFLIRDLLMQFDLS